MDGIGDAIEQAIFGMVCIAFVLGGATVLGLYFLVTWLWAHVSIGWV